MSTVLTDFSSSCPWLCLGLWYVLVWNTIGTRKTCTVAVAAVTAVRQRALQSVTLLKKSLSLTYESKQLLCVKAAQIAFSQKAFLAAASLGPVCPAWLLSPYRGECCTRLHKFPWRLPIVPLFFVAREAKYYFCPWKKLQIWGMASVKGGEEYLLCSVLLPL